LSSLKETPWGEIRPKVDTFPIKYLFIVYFVGFFFPHIIFKDYTIIRLWSRSEHLAEFFQLIGYLCSFAFSGLILIRFRKYLKKVEKVLFLLAIFIFLFISFEEISFLDLVGGVQSLKEINVQDESNLHNLNIINNYIHSITAVICIFLGWFGWRIFPNNIAIPKRKFSLYFLFPSLFYLLSFASLSSPNNMFVPYHHEVFEFLISLGLFLHFLSALKYLSKVKKIDIIRNQKSINI